MSSPRHSYSRHHEQHRRPDPLARLVRGIARQRAEGGKRPDLPVRDVHARLDALEHDVREVRTRINALFFAVLTAALVETIVQVAGRVAL